MLAGGARENQSSAPLGLRCPQGPCARRGTSVTQNETLNQCSHTLMSARHYGYTV